MTIAAALTGAALMAGTTTGAHPCRLGRILTSLDDTDRQAVREAVAGPTSDERVAHVLRANEHPVGPATVRRHRLGLCQCPSDEQDTA